MNKETLSLRICYFGIYDPEFCRNKVYRKGLIENGATVIECNDRSRGLLKYFRLFQKHWRIRNDYDVMIVGYPGYIMVPFARLLTRKPIIFDALCSFYEAQIISRDAYAGIPFRVVYVRFIDWMANTFADKILVETDAQRRYYEKELGMREGKCTRVFIGVDEGAFFYDPQVKKNEEFTVFFRGRLTIEAGFKHIIEAARLLENEPILFKAVGFGFGPVVTDIRERLLNYRLKNFTLLEHQMPIDDLRVAMGAAHVSLGQFEANERLSRTMPHKAFESLAMRLPYITARTSEDAGITELFVDRENCLFVKPADPADLAAKIKMLAGDAMLQAKLAENGFKTYQSRFTSRVLGRDVLAIVRELTNA